MSCPFPRYVTAGKKFDKVDKVFGTNKEKHPSIESSLDLEYLMGVAPNTKTWVFSVKGSAIWNDLLFWFSDIGNMSNIPLVHSISYGSQVRFHLSTRRQSFDLRMPRQAARPPDNLRYRLDSEFIKLGCRGISVIISSGD